MNRKVTISVIAGILSAGFAIAALIFVSHQLFPIKLDPEVMKQLSKEEQIQAILDLPVGIYLSVIVAQGLGILTGLIIGRLIYKSDRTPLYLIAGTMLLMGVINALSLPHPSWFIYADLGFSGTLSALYIFTRKKR